MGDRDERASVSSDGGDGVHMDAHHVLPEKERTPSGYAALPSGVPGLPGLPGPRGSNASTVGPALGKPSPTDGRSQTWIRARAAAEKFGESTGFVAIMTLFTFWALYQDDIKNAATTKEADSAFEVIISILFFAFFFEIILQSFYKDDYFQVPSWPAEPGESLLHTWFRRIQFGSFYFWLDVIATLSLMLDISWLIGDSAYEMINGGAVQSAQAGQASRTAIQAARVVRVVRMVRLVRMAKLYKYASAAAEKEKKDNLKKQVVAAGPHSARLAASQIVEDDTSQQESKVGAAMSDLTNRRVIVLILMMLIIIPLLTSTDPDISPSLGVQVVHALAVLNATNPALYESGLLLAIQNVESRLPLVFVRFNDIDYFKSSIFDKRRTEELATYDLSTGGFTTRMAYDQHHHAVQAALYSIYTTSFIIVLLLLGVYFFTSDVERLVIRPIERLVELVRKISANPLGVEYKMLGEKEGFIEGMETTMLLATITKIGALMRVGFGEAGASVIAKNLSEGTGGKLNLMGSGVMIRSIFGFCDVRQFTDTTECLQEEVMLFVNRIAHILHSIVVQCAGAANKNIGDAFLLTWKLDDQLQADDIALLADQALLTFCKALVELSRHQQFICNFSVAATARLYRRFPEYNVRIGCGLHVGWAIEGAIGSNRKIDASYLSPHVSATEYLESSTKAYGVSLLLSEPFYRLLSPAAAHYCRQVDRVRRSVHEEPMGLYTYDADLNINWNDPHRHNAARNPKDRLRFAAKRAATLARQEQENNSFDSNNNTAHNGGHNPRASIAVVRNNGGRRKSTVIELQGLNGLTAGGLRKGSEVHHVPPHMRRTSASPSSSNMNPHQPSHHVNTLGTLAESSGNNHHSGDVGLDTLEAGDLSTPGDEESKNKAKEAPTIIVPPYTQQVWTEDNDIVEMRHRVNDAFRVLWDQGIAAYIKGDWQKARDIFHETLRMTRNKDGPSTFLVGVIDESGGTAPSDWAGYRDEGAGGH